MLGEIITKSNVGRQQLTREETTIAIGIFYEALFGVIPEHRLNDCYLEALRTRQSTFPLKPEDLCTAWETVRQRDFYKRAPESRQLTHGFCEKCNNTGTEPIRNDRGITISSRPCKH